MPEHYTLKCAHDWQFLYESAENWFMPIVINLVPVLIHISLILFLGLVDYLFPYLSTTKEQAHLQP